MKKIVPWILVVVVAIAFVAYQRLTTVDIVDWMEEIRESNSETGNEIALYHRTLSIMDSLVYERNEKDGLIFIDSVIEANQSSMSLPIYLFEKGRLYFNVEKHKNAIESFDQAIQESDSFHIKAFVWRGFSKSLLGDCESGLSDLEFAKNQNATFAKDYDRVVEYCKEGSEF